MRSLQKSVKHRIRKTMRRAPILDSRSDDPTNVRNLSLETVLSIQNSIAASIQATLEYDQTKITPSGAGT